ncbi:MAG: protein-S-isoprenylcysteine O-methyltransferase [Pseudomonadota bacterium]
MSELQPNTAKGKPARGIIGAVKSKIPWTPLTILTAGLAIYLWRTELDPRWPFVAGVILLTGQLLVRVPFAHRVGSVTVARDAADRADLVIMYGVFLTMVVLPMLRLATPLLDRFDYSLPETLALVGVALYLFGLWLFWRSHADLGRQWSASLQIGEGHKLVTNGVYARIRHPMYSAIWLMIIAQPLLFQNWFAGPLAILAFGLLFVTRLPKEEAMMVETFVDEYERYKSRTGALTPKWGAESPLFP